LKRWKCHHTFFCGGRTQELIYELNKKKEVYDEKLKMLFATPVYIDSPMAISATEVFRNNLDCYDEEAREYIENGDNPLDFPGFSLPGRQRSQRH